MSLKYKSFIVRIWHKDEGDAWQAKANAIGVKEQVDDAYFSDAQSLISFLLSQNLSSGDSKE